MNREKAGWVNRLLFGLYLLAVWIAFFLLRAKYLSAVLGMTILSAAALFFAVPWLFRKIREIRLVPPETMKPAAVAALAFAATAAILGLWRWATWPGGFSPDSIEQYSQVISGHYSDWHPVWHTLVFFTLPVRLTGSGYSLFVFQDLVFCAAVAHAMVFLYQYGGKKFALFSWCFVMLNPFVCRTVMYPWKDGAFALASMTASVLAAEVWLTRGESGKKPLRWAALGIALANAALFRHNGILFSGFLLAALLFSMKKGSWWKAAAVFVLMMVLVRVPLYSALGVEKPDRRVSETTGLPISVIGNVAKEAPERLDEETADFAFAVASPELWKAEYHRSGFNSIKWTGANLDPIEEAGIGKMLRMTWHTFLRAPREALDGFIDLTDIVYGLDASLAGSGMPGLNGGQSWFVRENNRRLYVTLDLAMTSVDATPFRYLFSVGFTMIAVLAVMLARCDLRKWDDWKRILIALSLFCYNFGTMLLLTGPDTRFFLESFLVCPIFVLLMLYEREAPAVPAIKEEKEGEETE